jgi:2-oxoglutarate dehydrogenase E1 component
MHQPSAPAKKKRRLPFLDHLSPDYLESLERQYAADPDSLGQDWAFFFEAFRLGQGRPIIEKVSEDSAVIEELRVLELITAYRQRGHLLAEIDPLGLRQPPFDVHLDLDYFKLQSVDPQRVFQVAREIGLEPTTLAEIVKHLKATYCRSVGVEFHFLRDERVYQWIKQKVDAYDNTTPFTRDQKLSILRDLAHANYFENFLQNNYTGQKRFSIEGGESLIPALQRALSLSSEMGAEEVILGMAHRGRLNVLINILRKPVEEVLKEFEGAELPEFEEATGDVKYHQGFSSDVSFANGKKIHLSLAPNPSHLEFVNPVVEGMARAKIEERYGNSDKKLVPILIHGDAAVIGQGVVAETLNLSQLQGYKTGGTIHIVINNQIGFTTVPSDSRSAMYCTEYAKAFQCPIFHVNGNDPEAVVHTIELATEFRMTFGQDVFVDIVCYRKYGHNEGDEPRFTQPKMYDVIGKQQNPFQLYAESLKSQGVCDQSVVDAYVEELDKTLNDRRTQIKNARRVLALDSLKGHWSGLTRPNLQQMLEVTPTPVSPENFEKIIDTIHRFPEGMTILPKFRKMFETRQQKIEGEDEIDWATGEALAFGNLLLKGCPVRLSGQDSVRGTFSQRHSSFVDTQTGERYFPLNHLMDNQSLLSAFDSPLSEAAVLGFDYGYSLSRPNALTIWEAQFGDFVNGAQVIIDQFISSAETKWYRMSGLTLLLPHGYEGQGPEHSSARLERFLQLCSQLNMQVCYPTTPAQYAHMLQRQMFRSFRKPLIVMTPKSLLRNPMCISRKSDFTQGGFYPLLVDVCKKPEKVILCTGKVYYDLKKAALDRGLLERLLIIRVEQLYPADMDGIKKIYDEHSETPWIWVQEEPRNMGAWSYMRLRCFDHGIPLNYVGRLPSASPATGSPLQHQRELEHFLNEALQL